MRAASLSAAMGRGEAGWEEEGEEADGEQLSRSPPSGLAAAEVEVEAGPAAAANADADASSSLSSACLTELKRLLARRVAGARLDISDSFFFNTSEARREKRTE